MRKYITMLLLASIAITAMSQQTFQPKHPGILARQLGLGQKKDVRLALPQNQNVIKSGVTTRAAELEVPQLDSVVVSEFGALEYVQYYEYHPNGNVAKLSTMVFDSEGLKKEITRTEWTDNYPLKGSSVSEYGYDASGVYGVMYKMDLYDDYGRSYCVYSGSTGQLMPVERLSSTINESYQMLTETYYYYDKEGNELPEDSIVYTYDNDNRLVRETYFLADETGQFSEVGYFGTSYEEVETPSGLGMLIRLQDSDEKIRQDSICSNDSHYLYYSFYTKKDQAEWEKLEERIYYEFENSGLDIRLQYRDNAVYSGHKSEYEYKDNNSLHTIIAHEYSCGADTTQWVLVRRLEDYYYTEKSQYGRENSNHQSYIFEVDENGELHTSYDVLIYNLDSWIGPYTRMESEYYDGDEVTGTDFTYYYHDPNATAITIIQAQPEDGVMYDLSGRLISSDQLDVLMIKNGRVILKRE